MEIVGIVIAVIAAIVVLAHAIYRGLAIWSIVLWTAGALLVMIPIVPLYFLRHGPDPLRHGPKPMETRGGELKKV